LGKRFSIDAVIFGGVEGVDLARLKKYLFRIYHCIIFYSEGKIMPNRHQDWFKQALSEKIILPKKMRRQVMTPRNASSNFAKVRFPDYEKIKQELSTLAKQALQNESKIRAIYLFGSRALGNFSARSDADLLIIVGDDSDRPIDRIPHYLKLFQKAPIPIDVFPYTLAEIEKNAFAQPALQKGVLLSKQI
jgi:predicted nucleotidyltransferase